MQSFDCINAIFYFLPDKDYERMKGALFLLSAKTLTLPCLRDWRYAPEYVLRLCTAHHADKVQVKSMFVYGKRAKSEITH